MIQRVSAVLAAIYNIIGVVTAISVGLLLIFMHEPLLRWLQVPVFVGVYILLTGAIISVPMRLMRRRAKRRDELCRGFPVVPIKQSSDAP
jgi:uncharacterized membrane protein HdeD (DUF308 family)